MYCMHCGKELPEEAKFCFHCGKPVKDPEKKDGKPAANAAKVRIGIIIGIVLVGVIILAAVMGGLKNYNGKNVLEPEQEVETAAPAEQPEQEETAPEAETELEPEAVEVDSNSTIIPKLDDFYLKKRLFDKGNGDVGRKYEMKEFPESEKEEILEELFALLADPRYQLEPDWEDSYYYEDTGTSSYYYYYTYTGTNPDITEVYIDEANAPYTFKVSLWDFYSHDGVFNLGIFFNENFEEEPVGTHTRQNVGEQIAEAADSSGGDWEHNSDLYNHTPPASKLKCLTCDGDGDCNTCGGDGYKNIGGAKAGCNTCRGNGKCRSCGGSGTR